MKIKRSHLKYLIEKYLFEEAPEDEATKDKPGKDLSLNDFVATIKKNKDDEYKLTDSVRKTLINVADDKTKKEIENDESSYNEKSFTEKYGQLATVAYNKIKTQNV